MKKIISYIKLMRIHHYIKNLLIFLPIIFSKNIFNFQLMKTTIIGAIAFSLMASIVYIINDINDIDIDKNHEKKKFRPIASGEISIKNAYIFAIILFIITIILNICIISENMWYMSVLIFYGYLIMNVLYSIKLKHIPILDIVILAFGFLFRVIYGSIITGIEISNWLYLTILSLSFYMGLGKRRNELKKMGKKGRKVLEHYTESFLDNNMYMCISIGIVFYSLWCIDINDTLNGFINIIYTVPLVIIICMKYSLDIEKESSGGDPVDVILNDKILLMLTLLYAAIVLIIIYFRG